jgi:hypothetical protein
MDEEAAISQDADERHLPVLAAEPRVIERTPDAALPVPVAAATGGFLAGIAALVLVRALRSRPRRGVILRRRKSRAERALEIAASRSFLVDVHGGKR